jgi:hypothetical protein
MNNADTALAVGFDGLLAEAGDTITLRGGSVSAVIDWMPFEEKGANGIPDFDRQATSRIEIKSVSVSPAPGVGEIITTGGNVYHRIQKVRFNGAAWVLDCEVTL